MSAQEPGVPGLARVVEATFLMGGGEGGWRRGEGWAFTWVQPAFMGSPRGLGLHQACQVHGQGPRPAGFEFDMSGSAQCPVLSDDGSRVGVTQAACASQRRQLKRLLQDLLANTQAVCVLCMPV